MTEFVPNQSQRDHKDRELRALLAKATRIDLMVVVVIFFIALTIAILLRSSVFAWLGVMGCLLYNPLLVWRRGATLGHSLSGLKLVDGKTGARPNLKQAIVRCFIADATTHSHPSVLYLTVNERQHL